MLVTSEDISQELEEFGIGEQVQDDELMKCEYFFTKEPLFSPASRGRNRYS